MPAATLHVELPGGRWDGRSWCRDAVVRPLGDEAARDVAEATIDRLPAERASALLDLCVASVGGAAAPARDLAAGDRDALLLHLWRVEHGDALPCVLDCPACFERLELELSAAALLVAPPARSAGPSVDVTLPEGGGARVRPLTGADLEDAARLAVRDVDAAAALLADRAAAEPAEATEAALAAADPQADLQLDLTCPACGATWTSPFDPAAYVLAEVDARARRLEREVHVLASHYGWSERDIVAMPAARRSRYVERAEAAA